MSNLDDQIDLAYQQPVRRLGPLGSYVLAFPKIEAETRRQKIQAQIDPETAEQAWNYRMLRTAGPIEAFEEEPIPVSPDQTHQQFKVSVGRRRRNLRPFQKHYTTK